MTGYVPVKSNEPRSSNQDTKVFSDEVGKAQGSGGEDLKFAS